MNIIAHAAITAADNRPSSGATWTGRTHDSQGKGRDHWSDGTTTPAPGSTK